MSKEALSPTVDQRVIPDYLWKGKIGDYITYFYNGWEEVCGQFRSEKARQELMAKMFFPPGLFVPRHVIKAADTEGVFSAINKVSRMQDVFLGVRSAYSFPRLCSAPWVMRKESENPEDCAARAISAFESWMKQEDDKPEAIIVMENPNNLGSEKEKKNSFILRACIIHYVSTVAYSSSISESLILEGGAWTDQTRNLERNLGSGAIKFFRGEIPFEIIRGNGRIVVTSGIQWKFTDSFIDPEIRELLENINDFCMKNVNLSDLIARLEAIYYVGGHDTIQFQGRRNPDEKRKTKYFDFLLGYNLRGHENVTR